MRNEKDKMLKRISTILEFAHKTIFQIKKILNFKRGGN